MDDTIVDVICEKCKSPFEMGAGKYEKAEEDEQPILCDACYDSWLNEQEKENKPPQRCFEYKVAMIPSLSTDVEITQGIFDEVSSLNARGQDGWELIQVQGDKAYFKRLYFKE